MRTQDLWDSIKNTNTETVHCNVNVADIGKGDIHNYPHCHQHNYDIIQQMKWA